MRRPVYLMTCALGLTLLLAVLTGCAAESAKDDKSLTSGTKSGSQAEQPAEAPAEESGSAELPPAPTDVSGLQGWFEKAYPDAAWLSRIKSIEYVPGEVPDSGGFSNAIVITTDLDFGTELALGQEIAAALGEAHLDWAKQYIVWFADGNNMQAGDIFDPTP